MPAWHAVLVHPELAFASGTERMLATARVLREQGARVTLVARGGSRATAAEDAGCELVELELPTQPRRAPFAVARTKAALRELEPDVVHYTDGSLAGLAAAVAAQLDVPYLLELHGRPAEALPWHPERLASAVVPNEALREVAVNHGRLPKDRLRVLPHAPRPVELDDPGPFEREGPPTIGCSGFLDAGFDSGWFLEAARLVDLSGAACRWVILGEGPDERALRREMRQAGLASKMTVAVPTSASVGDTLARLDVHVACRTHGPGWLAASALVQGIPSIFAAVGEAFQLVQDRRTGILAEPGDAQRLADALLELLRNKMVARAMGAAGRELALERVPAQRFEGGTAELHAIALGKAVAQPG